MITVKELIRAKGTQVWSVAPQATAFDALQIMADKNVGALVVVDQGKLVGIFSERDYARNVVLKNRKSDTAPVRDYMTEHVFVVHPEQTIADCMAMMTEHHIRHLPVIENDRLVGIISIGDVVKEIISDQEFTIRSLEKYITNQ